MISLTQPCKTFFVLQNKLASVVWAGQAGKSIARKLQAVLYYSYFNQVNSHNISFFNPSANQSKHKS